MPVQMFLDRFAEVVARTPHKLAMQMVGWKGDAQEGVTFQQLHRGALGFARALADSGADRGRCLLLLPQSIDYARAFLACQLAGFAPVTLFPPNARAKGRFDAVIQDCKPTVGFVDSAGAQTIRELIATTPSLRGVIWINVDDCEGAEAAAGEAAAGEAAQDVRHGPPPVAFIQYTSGSTASPKGVVVAQEDLAHHILVYAAITESGPESVWVSWLPLFHDFGLIGGMIQTLAMGSTLILMSPAAFIRRPLVWLEAISRYRGTHTGAPNFAYDLCVERVTEAELAGLDLSSLRLAINGAEPVKAATLRRFRRTFAPAGLRPEVLSAGYGLAEATLTVSLKKWYDPHSPLTLHVDREQLAAGRAVVAEPGERTQEIVNCGTPYVGVEIVDRQSRRPLPEGWVGELWINGPSTAKAYFGRSEETAATFEAELDEPGRRRFLRTGDLGFRHGGELYLTGRAKDVLIIYGQNHYPQDLEATALGAWPGLEGSRAAAILLDEHGPEVALVVEVSRGLSRGSRVDLEAAATGIADAVGAVHGVDVAVVALVRAGGIPLTSSGKIQRAATRQALADRTLRFLLLRWRGVTLDGAGDGSMAERLPEPLG
jgi:acyl-CoA synthetase (AMP-forming)/AMP-acid ligase II